MAIKLSPSILEKFQSILDGIVIGGLSVEVVYIFNGKAMLDFYLVDNGGRKIVRIQSCTIESGASVTLLGIEKAFNVTLG